MKNNFALSAVQSVCHNCQNDKRPFCRSGCPELAKEHHEREKEKEYRRQGRDPPFTAAAVKRERYAARHSIKHYYR